MFYGLPESILTSRSPSFLMVCLLDRDHQPDFGYHQNEIRPHTKANSTALRCSSKQIQADGQRLQAFRRERHALACHFNRRLTVAIPISLQWKTEVACLGSLPRFFPGRCTAAATGAPNPSRNGSRPWGSKKGCEESRSHERRILFRADSSRVV